MPFLSTVTNQRISSLWLVLILTLAATAAVAAAQSGPPSSVPPRNSQGPGGNETASGNETDAGNETGDGGNGTADDGNETHRGHGKPDRVGRPHDDPRDQRPGRASLGNGTVDGVYLTYRFSDASGQILDYTVFNTMFFSEVQAPGPFDARAAGPHVRLAGDDFRLATMDNPTGLLCFRGEGEMRFMPAQGVAVEVESNRLVVTSGDLTAILTDGEWDGQTIVAQNGTKFLLYGPSVSVVSRSVNPAEHAILAGIEDARVGGRFQVLPHGVEAVAFDDVKLTASEPEEGSYRFIVDGNLTDGRSFVLDFAPGLVRADQVTVRYYDEEAGVLIPAEIQEADGLEDVLDAEDGEGPEYWIVNGMDGAQVLVAVPSFSVHAFEVIPAELAPLIAYGLVFGVLFCLMATVALLFGRSAKPRRTSSTAPQTP